MKKGGRGASMAESGPGCNNLWVTLRSMGGFPLTGKETCLLTITSTKDGERETERERETYYVADFANRYCYVVM